MSTKNKNILHSIEKTNSEKLTDLYEEIKTLKKLFKNTKYRNGILNFFLYKKIEEKESEYLKLNKKSITEIGTGSKTIHKTDISNMEAFSNFLLGTDYNMKPIWINNLQQHMTVFGASGSGKSVFLFNLLKQVLEKGGGACMVDGKGDTKMFENFKRFADDYDRTSDVLVLNFNQGADSNSFNIFESLPLTDVYTIFKSIGISGDDFFAKQTETVLKATFNILKFMEYKKRKINFQTFDKILDLNIFMLQKIPPSKEDSKKPDSDMLKWNGLTGYSDFWMEKEYLIDNVPAFQEVVSVVDSYGCEMKLEDPLDITEYKCVPNAQLIQQIGGYSFMTLKKISSLSKKFDNIFNAPKNDINFVDIIAQNKLIYVIIPAMKEDEETPQVIGAFIISAIKNAVGSSLGNEVSRDEGLYYEFNEQQIKSNPIFLLILDEMHAFVGQSKEAVGQLMAQARAVGVSCIVSSQEISSLSKGDGGKEFVGQIFSNASTQVFLKILDDETLSRATPLIRSEDTVDEKGNTKEILDEKEIKKFLKEAENGLGVASSKGFERFLTPWADPKSENPNHEINR